MFKIRKGDRIKCRDAEDAIETMQSLEKEGIVTDFVYENEGETGIWLEIMAAEVPT